MRARRRAPARYRGRFAPSPTGPLHFGSLVAALASYCDARAAGGEWLVRIEDVDEPRSRPGAEAQILATLERYGFAVGRRGRAAIGAHRALRSSARATARGRARLRVRVHAPRTGARAASARPASASIRAPAATACRRRASGAASVRWRVRVGDAVRRRAATACRPRSGRTSRATSATSSSSAPTACSRISSRSSSTTREQAITDVVRGADLLASTPRQIFLQRLLGLPTPSYLHVPVAINAAGEKLSKQTRAPRAARRRRCRRCSPRGVSSTSRRRRTPPANVAEFWRCAIASWRAARLPPVPMLPAAA